jgi:hypothetical protein
VAVRRSKTPRRGSARSASSRKAAGPLLEQQILRRRWLRIAAYILGPLVLMAHVYNFPNPPLIQKMFPKDIRDVIYHSSMLGSFALVFRASLADQRPPHPRHLSGAELAGLSVGCGWGALCECLQIFIPGREFHLSELALNMGIPLVVVALYSMAARRVS